MPKTKTPIIFFGSGPVAAASLEGILDDFHIELVVTKNRPPHHKGSAPVEELARKNEFDIGFADSKIDVDKVLGGRILKSKVGLIIDYGVILSAQAIRKFEKGVINSHFSLLPRWRGADPITYSLLAGDSETGVSLMKIVPKLEEGPIISQKKLPILPQTDVISLTEQLVKLSNSMVIKNLPLYLKGKLEAKPQSGIGVSYSHKIKKSDGIISWEKPAIRIEREIRAYAGWPKSRTNLGGMDLIITKAYVVPMDSTPGKIDIPTDGKSLIVYCGSGYLCIERLQPAGKKEMSAEEFLRGYGFRLNI